MGRQHDAAAHTVTSTESPTVASSFARIMTWADANAPLLRVSLRPGASADELQRFETLIGQALPQDVRDLYRLADGQIPFQFGRTPHYPGLFLSLPFNPIEVVIRDWQFGEEVLGRNEPNTDEFLSSYPPGAVKALHYNNGWIPLSDDAGGNHMAIDLDPGPAGNAGQWIIFGVDEFERMRVASSLAAFLHWVAVEMEAGNFRLAPDNPEGDEWRWRDHGHLHDGLKVYLKGGGQIG
jgi:cell wall assembly regulator SMI1